LLHHARFQLDQIWEEEGAGRTRLVRFVMLESLLLSGTGAALGTIVALSVVRAVRTLEIRGIPRLTEAGLNPWVLGFAVVIAVLTGLLSGLAPAVQAPARGIAAALREGDRQTGNRGQGRLRAVLVTAEVALSFLVLVGAGLLIRSFNKLMNVDRGFQTEHRLLFSVSVPGSYRQRGVGKQFLDRFFERLSSEPDVIAAGAVSHRPVEGGNPGMAVRSQRISAHLGLDGASFCPATSARWDCHCSVGEFLTKAISQFGESAANRCRRGAW
jgi:hypothetical protein